VDHRTFFTLFPSGDVWYRSSDQKFVSSPASLKESFARIVWPAFVKLALAVREAVGCTRHRRKQRAFGYCLKLRQDAFGAAAAAVVNGIVSVPASSICPHLCEPWATHPEASDRS